MSWFPGEGITHFTEIFLAQKWNSYIPWSWNRAGWCTRKWQGGKISIGVERICWLGGKGMSVEGERHGSLINLQDVFGKTDLLALRTALLTEPWIALGRWTLAVKRFPPGVGSHREGTQEVHRCESTRRSDVQNQTQGLSPASPDCRVSCTLSGTRENCSRGNDLLEPPRRTEGQVWKIVCWKNHSKNLASAYPSRNRSASSRKRRVHSTAITILHKLGSIFAPQKCTVQIGRPKIGKNGSVTTCRRKCKAEPVKNVDWRDAENVRRRLSQPPTSGGRRISALKQQEYSRRTTVELENAGQIFALGTSISYALFLYPGANLPF